MIDGIQLYVKDINWFTQRSNELPLLLLENMSWFQFDILLVTPTIIFY